MALIRVDHDIDKLVRFIDSVKDRQVPFATAKALTLTAKEAQKDTYREFERKFDRPTPLTMRSLFIKPATKRDLTSEVFVKDRAIGGKNSRSTAELLRHQFGGGTRIVKRLEQVLRVQGFIDQDEFVVPGAAAKLDRYGNMSRGQLSQMLSQIGVGAAGYDNRSTGSARSRRNVAKAGRIFWSLGKGTPSAGVMRGLRKKFDIDKAVDPKSTQHLPKGAWMRAGLTVKPILIVVGASPNYRRRIDMAAIARNAVRRDFNRLFAEAYAEAVRTAR